VDTKPANLLGLLPITNCYARSRVTASVSAPLRKLKATRQAAADVLGRRSAIGRCAIRHPP